MDPHRKLTDSEAAEALRALFAAHGTVDAPSGVDARIMARIMATQARPTRVRSLIPKTVLIGTGIVLLTLSLYILIAPEAATDATAPVFNMPSDVLALLGSKWTLMTVMSGGLLLLFNSYLSRRHTAQVA